MIQVGETLPNARLTAATAEGPQDVATDDIFRGKRAVLFGVPGAFTPTCTAQHLPGFVHNAAALREKGIDRIVCMAVNDAFVLSAWAHAGQVPDDILMLADGSAVFTRALGLTFDLTARGLGIRCQRFALVADNRKVTYLGVEKPGEFAVSRAEAVLDALG